MAPDRTALDLTLLNGFSFGCRPDCGLCCYATPAATAAETARLLQIEPALTLLAAEGRFQRISARPNGGACQLLRTNRCGAHSARPFPCRTYPLLIHVGTQAIASVVLACPGVDLSPLARLGGLPSAGPAGPEGLEQEIRAAQAELHLSPLPEWVAAHGRAEARLFRRLARMGSVEDPEAIVADLTARPPGPEPGWAAGLSVPPAEAELEELPLFFDERFGRVAMRAGPRDGTYELVALRETGGVADRIGTFAVPVGPWRLSAEAERLLEGYERYLLARGHLIWSTYLELDTEREGSFAERLRENLVDAATEVLRRASVRGLAAGTPSGTLGADAVAQGIRATDAELLDRPTLGRIL
ncbi:MAG: YkgJ family cysteine cluster protein [Thermoplasmata archaeon]